MVNFVPISFVGINRCGFYATWSSYASPAPKNLAMCFNMWQTISLITSKRFSHVAALAALWLWRCLLNIQMQVNIRRRRLDAYKVTTPFAFGKIYSVIVVSCGNKCFNPRIKWSFVELELQNEAHEVPEGIYLFILLFIYTLMHTNYKLKTNYPTTTSAHQAQ